MKKYQNITGTAVAGLVIAAIAVIGIITNQAAADVVYPGTASAWVYLKFNTCQDQSIPTKITLTPPAGKKYYFKERTFEVKSGLTTLRWVVRKIPEGEYTVAITTPLGVFSPPSYFVNLAKDQSNYVGEFALDLCPGGDSTTPTVAPATATPRAAATLPQEALQPESGYTTIISPDGETGGASGTGSESSGGTTGEAPGPPLPILE